MINKNEIKLLREALDTLEAGFTDLPEFEPDFDAAALTDVLGEVAERMQDNYPYFHPQYAGQMLKPPHPVARIAYAMSLWINPNNHALDGGRASSAMEKECIVALGAMFGWQNPLGHLTGGGTMANLEALWYPAVCILENASLVPSRLITRTVALAKFWASPIPQFPSTMTVA